MNRYFYDLHIHSCLSPCGDRDMTPQNIAGMAAVKGLQIVALTDHNTCQNCAPFFAACRRHRIFPVAGMELTTAEDIHLVCLFRTLEDALSFDTAVRAHYMNIKNRPDLFGEQLILDENDAVIGREEMLLVAATTLDIGSAVALARAHGGIVYPAHVDREANGIVAVLGDIPPDYGFTAAEFHNPANIAPYRQKYPALQNCKIVCSSDAHYLWDIQEAEQFLELDDPKQLFNILFS